MGRSSEITVRERAFIGGVMTGKSQAQAARDAGYPESKARHVGSQLAARPDIRAHMRALMDEIGIGDSALVTKLRDGMDAKQRGMTKDGDVVELGEDWHARAKFVDMALKLADYYPNKLDVDVNLKGAIVVLRPEDAIAPDPFGVDVLDGDFVEQDTNE